LTNLAIDWFIKFGTVCHPGLGSGSVIKMLKLIQHDRSELSVIARAKPAAILSVNYKLHNYSITLCFIITISCRMQCNSPELFIEGILPRDYEQFILSGACKSRISLGRSLYHPQILLRTTAYNPEGRGGILQDKTGISQGHKRQ